MASKLGTSLQNALRDFLAPLEVASSGEARLRDLLGVLGPTHAVSSNPTVKQIIGNAGALTSKVAAFDTGKLDSLQSVQDLIEIGSEVQTVLRQLQSVQDPALAGIASGLAEELLAFLLASYLRRLHPTLFRVGSLLTLIDSRETGAIEPDLEQNGETLRYARVHDQFRFSAIQRLLSHPGQTLKDAYLPNGMATGLDARLGAHQLFPQLAFLAEILGLSWRIETQQVTAAPSPPPLSDESLELDHFGSEDLSEDGVLRQPVPLPNEFFDKYYSTFTFVLRPPDSNGGAGVSINVLASSLRHPGATAGYILALTGMLNSTDALSSWRLTLSAKGQVPAFVLGPTGFSSVARSVPVAEGAARVLVESVPPAHSTGPAFVLGGANSSRVEFGTFRFATDLFYGSDRGAIEVTADASSAALVMVPGDSDGFLQNVLPKEGMRLNVDLGLLLSSDKGFTFRGSGGLDATFPVGLSLGAVTVPTVHMSLHASDASLTAEVSASVGVSIGPVHVAIERVGIAAGVTFPKAGGNLGVADLELHFKPPTSLGLVIDAPAVVGGGYLFFDPQKEEYSGILQLEVEETIAVKAIGLLTTRMPDGSEGFSLVVIMSAEGLAPIQLGFGFTLTGIGGVLGVNRTVMVDVLRSGLKNGTLGSILFPADPIRNAPQIVSDLRAVFPPVKDRYVFGPMAIIAWGTPTILTLELGLILELPEPVRLIIPGRLRAVLPDERTALVQVRMDAIGVIDFNKGEVSLDATLYDSRILQFVLTGDMALRANWGAQPNFVLAIGGFNPRFPAPAGFPQLARLALSPADSDNPRLRFEAYLALTSNTAQFGARLDFSYSAAGFTLAGFLGFDALFQFAPFQFIADVGAMVALKRGSRLLMGLFLDMTLAGPTPWHVWGKATFKVLFFKVSIRFDHHFGREDPPALPEPIDVLTLLAEALRDRRNWSSALPRGEHPIVSLRDSATTQALRVHPLAELTVRQRVVPLNRPVTKFGNAPLAEGTTVFTVAASGIDNTSTMVREAFALAQFQELSDEEKLTQPSFETQDAGLQFGVDEATYQDDALLDTAILYETLIIDPTRPPEKVTEPYVLPQAVLDAVVSLGAAGQAVIRRSGSSRYRELEHLA